MPIFIFLIPGIIAYALKQKGMLDYARSDEVFPTLVGYLLPVGLRGLVAGGLMAALMSSLASVFNSSSTLFTVDIFKKMYPDASEARLVRTGRWATGIVVVLGMLWIPIMQKIGGGVLYQYLQSVQSYIAPPITAVFLLGILWKRTNARGAIVTLLFGLVVGALRIILELMKDDLSGFAEVYATLNFAHFAIFNFLACVAVCVVASLTAQAPSPEKVAGLTLGTLTAEQKRANRDSYSLWDVLISVLLLVIVITILVYFRG